MSFGMHFPESPAKRLFPPCFHIHYSSSVLWDALLAEVVLVLLTNKIPSIYSVPVQRFFSAGSTFSFSWSESLLLAVQSPISKTVAFVCFFGSLPWNIPQNGWSDNRLSRLVCHRPSVTVIVVVAKIAPTKVKLLKNTSSTLHTCYYSPLL